MAAFQVIMYGRIETFTEDQTQEGRKTGRLLRARERITSHFRIPASGHLRPILNREILDVASYACGFAQSDRPNLTQIWARKWEVILARTLRARSTPGTCRRLVYAVSAPLVARAFARRRSSA